jgi:hypothetical protein
VLSNWRASWQAGVIGDRLATTLGVVECATLTDAAGLHRAVQDARQAGVEPSALVSAGYINLGFNVINRVADGVGVRLPDAPDLARAAQLLLTIGYRPLSGNLLARRATVRPGVDPFAPLLCQLEDASLAHPAALSGALREALRDGTATGLLADFGRQVADRPWSVTAADVAVLQGEGCTDDEIFEAAVCAALGAGKRRLDPLLHEIGRVSSNGRWN